MMLGYRPVGTGSRGFGMSRSSRSWRARLSAFLVVPMLIVGLAACVPETTDGTNPRTAAPGATGSPTPTAEPQASVAPQPVGHLREPDPLGGSCFRAPTTMSVWAHYDDDLLFVGSRLDEALHAGMCVRTVFLTGGDAGRGAQYAAGREQGIMRAYNVMRGSQSAWSSSAVDLDTGAKLAVWRPDDDPRISLVFFHLPDGNLGGQGFPATGDVSLQKLMNGSISSITSLDGSYALDWRGMVTSISELVSRFRPATLLTHVPADSRKWSTGDHADHATVGMAVRAAWQQAGLSVDSVSYAIGYPIANLPANITGDALARKIAAFSAYAADDPVVKGCRDIPSCLKVPRFGDWVQRQYLHSDGELWQ
jgi:LmbE family N-acetylglucosaminyl deacetylase